MGGGSPPNVQYGVDAKAGENAVMLECSMIGTSGYRGSMWQHTLKGGASARGPSPGGSSWLWWLGVMLDTEERVRLLPSHLD